MIIYSVTYALDESIEHDWINFMKSYFIPVMMDSGYFEDYTFTRVLAQESVDVAYNVQYRCFNHEKLNLFICNAQNNIDDLLHQRYSGKLGSFYTKLEEII